MRRGGDQLPGIARGHDRREKRGVRFLPDAAQFLLTLT